MEYEHIVTIKQYLDSTWGIKALDVVEVKNSSASCYFITTDQNRFFFKIYQSKFTFEQVSNEVQICNFLKNNGHNVSVFIISKSNLYIEKFNNNFCTVQLYISGETYDKFQAPKPLLYESARKLAELNVTLKNYPHQLSYGFDKQWRSTWSADFLINKYDSLSTLLTKNDVHSERISQDFRLKRQLIQQFSCDKFDFSQLTLCNTHGDYNILQLILDKSHIHGIIDFSSCAKLPICWELIRSYSLSSKECVNATINIENFQNYLFEYIRINPLGETDLLLMPHFYLYTLLESTFGYKTYIQKMHQNEKITAKDIATLNFAFWRTQMCLWLSKHADSMGSTLTSILLR